MTLAAFSIHTIQVCWCQLHITEQIYTNDLWTRYGFDLSWNLDVFHFQTYVMLMHPCSILKYWGKVIPQGSRYAFNDGTWKLWAVKITKCNKVYVGTLECTMVQSVVLLMLFETRLASQSFHHLCFVTACILVLAPSACMYGFSWRPFWNWLCHSCYVTQRWSNMFIVCSLFIMGMSVSPEPTWGKLII